MVRPPPRSIKKLLIANRGEIATRIAASARELSLETYALYTTDDDSHTLGVAHAIQLSSPAVYLDITELISIAKKHGIDAVHPGYGFLSESAEFAKRMWEGAHAVVIGPGWEILSQTGDKLKARQLALDCEVPVLPAMQSSTDRLEDVTDFAQKIGCPLIIKAVDGGGGRGIRIVKEMSQLRSMLEQALRESPCRQIFAEKAAIEGFRHVEVQIVGDGNGNVRHLWERECSIQRRFQKVVEFAPSSIPDRKLVSKVIEAALKMARKVNYLSLGTFEFLVHPHTQEFYFLEVNPRLQVEHTITESICMGIDLVKTQLLLAMGQSLQSVDHLPTDPTTPPPLHSLQLRITAEDASHNWSLSIGKINSFRFPSGLGIRVDTHMLSTRPTNVKTDFDSLLAKLIITGPTWMDVVSRARRALQDTRIEGVKSSLDALRGIIGSQEFEQQVCDTQWLEKNMQQVLSNGQRLSATAPILVSEGTKSSAAAGLTASSLMLRKGDAWSIVLAEGESKSDAAAQDAAGLGHLQLTRVLRNEFPTSLSAVLSYTTPSGTSTPYSLSISTTTASAGAVTSGSKHRKGDAANGHHIVVPFPGQLVEILVEVGDVLAKGDVVAVIRQMKMELEVRASRPGVVTWAFDGEEGEDVGEGILIVELESGGESKL